MQRTTPARITELRDALKSTSIEATWQTRRSVADLAQATAKGKPAIAHVFDWGGHYVVVDGVTFRQGRAVVAIRDPAMGQSYFQTVEDFAKKFSGQVVILP